MDAQRAQALLTDAYAQLGAVAEPIMTTLKTMAADVAYRHASLCLSDG